MISFSTAPSLICIALSVAAASSYTAKYASDAFAFSMAISLKYRVSALVPAIISYVHARRKELYTATQNSYR
jgi:hypothetical protein